MILSRVAVLPPANPMICWFSLNIPVTFDTFNMLDPSLHEVTLALATSVDPDFCTIYSPTLNPSVIKLDKVNV